MVTPSSASSNLVGQEDPTYILFREQDGIFWLRGDHLLRAKELLHLNVSGSTIGFDADTVSLYVSRLQEKHQKVGIARGTVVRLITPPRSEKPKKVARTPIELAPGFLFGRRELDRLCARLVQRQGVCFKAEVERIQSGVMTSQSVDPGDLGTVFVYQVAEDWYEIDWELTTIPRIVVEALAVATYRLGRILRCQLVPPKPRRGGARRRRERKVALAGESTIIIEDLVDYQQLALPW